MKNWLRLALLNFLFAAILGTMMRYAFVEELTWLNYRHVLHGHSHIAMLGWVYLALYALLIHTFLPPERQRARFYKLLFWLTQGSVIGMLIAFPLQGYAGWSIAFSSLHIIFSYCFAWRFLRDLGGTGTAQRFVKAALWFMILSTIAIWGMVPITVSGMKGSALYYATVQFYLHFQFNGWFIFAILALFFKLLENRQIFISPLRDKTFFYLLVISCFLTYALAVTWSNPLPVLFWINSTGVTLQLMALIAFFILIRGIWPALRQTNFRKWILVLLVASLCCFVLKIAMQTVVILPAFATVAYTIRNFVLGFLHLLLLGMVTCFLIGYAAQRGLIVLRCNLARAGLVLILLGFVLTELLLFVQGLMFWGAMGFLPAYYEAIFGASVLLPLGVGLLLFAQVGQRPGMEKSPV